eukprot:GHVU01147361.1.p2 GENE.GHVU01147361.1~~GHVU01147361.1.p2  ORF type:complete len:210 (+),score=10.29 GHVU01147361.1:1091-1720(+)
MPLLDTPRTSPNMTSKTVCVAEVAALGTRVNAQSTVRRAERAEYRQPQWQQPQWRQQWQHRKSTIVFIPCLFRRTCITSSGFLNVGAAERSITPFLMKGTTLATSRKLYTSSFDRGSPADCVAELGAAAGVGRIASTGEGATNEGLCRLATELPATVACRTSDSPACSPSATVKPSATLLSAATGLSCLMVLERTTRESQLSSTSWELS